MLNIIKSKLKNTYKKKSLNNPKVTIYNKDFVPAVRDWNNSIYVYNKNALSLIPVASRFVLKLIKGYLNSYNLNIEYKLRKKIKILRHRLRKLSINKIFVSDGEFKHTNDKVNITLYIYNRQRLNYLLKIVKKYKRLFKNRKLLRKFKLIRNIGLNIIKQQEKKGKIITNVLPNYSSKVSSVQNLYYKYFINKSIMRLKYYMYYKQLLYINKAKFDNLYLQGLISLIKKIYKKKVEFNIINLKYFYFNSDILTESLILKLRKRKITKVLKYLTILVDKVKIKNIKIKRPKYFFDLDSLFTVNNDDITNTLLKNLMEQNKTSSKYLKKIVLSNIKYKRISGVRLEAAGRLTKRSSASKSQQKLKYKGNLDNVYSYMMGYNPSILRGNIKPNLNYTNLNSKFRSGSFGIKGWLSGS